jgi:murein DD-endopeptidase MepM/ murein hydrolase activator NlpD
MSENTNASGEHVSSSGESDATVSVPRRIVEWLANRNMFVLMGVFFGLGFAADRSAAPEPVDTLLFLLGGILPLVLATVSTREDGHSYDLSIRTRATLLVSQLRWAFTPWGLLTQTLQIGGTALAYIRHRGRLPSRHRHLPATELTAPFDGEWTTINGGVTKPTSHSWGIVTQRYAYDFVVTDDDGNTHRGDGDDLTDYYAFGKPIRAPADGRVVKTRDGLRDYPNPGTGQVEWRTWDIAGNHVVIKHGDGEYSTLAHLKQDSIRVRPGDEVERGDVVGECGNSGHSSEPHLHFQLQDHRNFWVAAGLVPRFTDVTVDRPDDRRADHDVYRRDGNVSDELFLWAGDRVSPRDAPTGGERT